MKIEFTAMSTFVSTGDKKKMYTLRVYGCTQHGIYSAKYVQNLSIDKQKAVEKGRLLSAEMGLPFNEEIDFDLKEIERKERAKQEEQAQEAAQERDREDVESKWAHILAKHPDALEGQEKAIYHIIKGDNVFISGPGGVGKSWVVNQVKTPNTLIAAPTGIAAINVGGTTCHALFGLPTKVVVESDFKKGAPSDLVDLVKADLIDRIVIDEASMLRYDQIALMEHRMRMATGENKPWGGIQVVMVGDFYQLPPFVRNEYKNGRMIRDDQKMFWERYPSLFCFESEAWNFTTVELTKVVRQDNERQVKMLGHIRKNTELAKKALYFIQKEARKYDPYYDAPTLCTTNKRADEINKVWYARMKGKEKIYYADSDDWGELPPVDYKLKLKVGTKIILCVNNYDDDYRNGERGEVLALHYRDVDVKLDDGRVVNVKPYKWEKTACYKGENGTLEWEVVGEFEQLPIKLGWAITINRSQGMTLDAANIDVGSGCFNHGQLYVALSRVKDLTNLAFVTPVKYERDLDKHFSKEVEEFYSREA